MMATWLLVPAGAVIGVFSGELLQAWTGNQSISAAGAPIVTLLVVGTVINGLMNVPYALQLAHAWTSPPLRLNVVLAIVAVPAVILLARSYGALGVAMVWPGANVISAAIMIPLTHAQFARETSGSGIVRDVPVAIVASIAVVVIIHAFTPARLTRVEAIAAAGLAWAVAASVVGLLSSELRRELSRYLVRS
jgi:O-antigen/teichoic acid export membrane protein